MFDLKQYIGNLAAQVQQEGITGTHRFSQHHLESAVQVLYEAIQYEDAAYRSLGVSMGLRMLASAMVPNDMPLPRPKKTPSQLPPAPPAHVAIDELPLTAPTVQRPTQNDLHSQPPLQVGCPRCHVMGLVAVGYGNPLPVLCKYCEYQGVLA